MGATSTQAHHPAGQGVQRITRRQFHNGQTGVPNEVRYLEEWETIRLAIDASTELTIRPPIDAKLADVEGVLEDRKEWILGKLYGLAEQADRPRSKEFPNGEKLRYLGRQYPLDVIESDVPEPRLSFDGTEFTLEVHRFDGPADDVSIRRKRQAVVDWYIRRAEAELPDRVERYVPKLEAEAPNVEVGELKARWGEYEDGTVRLNWRLILAPVRI